MSVNCILTNQIPSAAEVGARPSTWTPTASDVGALALDCSNSLSSTHDYDGVSIKNQGQSKEARYWQDSSGNVHIATHHDDSNYTVLIQKVLEEDVNLADLLSLYIEGTGSYRIYGEHNKPTPAQLGAMSMGHITNNANIDTLPDGIYFYNGWASPHITCTAGLPFTNKQGIWIKKTAYGTDGGTTDREDTVINCETGAVYTMHYYDGTWHSGKDLFLPLDGSVPMSGSLGVANNLGGFYADINGVLVNQYETRGDFHNRRGVWVHSKSHTDLTHALQFFTIENSADKLYNIFGEHNKPTGTYTGNGSATSRTIDVGTGLGTVLFIDTAGARFVLASTNGAVAFSSTLKSVQYFSSSEVKYDYSTGTLTIATTNDCLNYNGWGYHYCLL